MPTIRVFDIETTGIDPKDHRVIEIAAYDLNSEDKSIVRVGAQLVLPGRDIPPEASAIHHLTDADLAEAIPFDQAWAQFTEDAPTIFAGHSCEFEQGFLSTPAGTQWICTLKCSLRAWPDAPAHGNQVLRYHHKLDTDCFDFDRALASPPHRAGPDAYVTAYLLREILDNHSIDDLLKWTKEPRAYPTITFGKHRGSKWTDVPDDYLKWMLRKPDMEADARHCAKRELARRAKPGKPPSAPTTKNQTQPTERVLSDCDID